LDDTNFDLIKRHAPPSYAKRLKKFCQLKEATRVTPTTVTLVDYVVVTNEQNILKYGVRKQLLVIKMSSIAL